MLISLVAAVSARNAGNSEILANVTRTQALAMQAAEAGLRYCEKVLLGEIAGPVPLAAPVGGAAYAWSDLANWDGGTSGSNVTAVPFGDAGSGEKAYLKRKPECMSQYQSVGTTATVVITARGFGPEVAATDAARAAPQGTEIWLQSLVSR